MPGIPLGQTIYASQRSRLVLWVPVLFGIGIALYFAPASEPSVWWSAGFLIPLAGLFLLRTRERLALRGVLIGCTVMSLGLSTALWDGQRRAAPVISHPIGETVEGRVLGISRSASGAPRLLLDRLVIYGMEPDETPARIRLTALDRVSDEMPPPGTRIRAYATLMPAGLPVEPGAFDFRRRAFFERLGGVGLIRGHIVEVEMGAAASLSDRARLAIAQVRDTTSRGLRSMLPGPEGAFAAALIVGDRADIDEADAEALRASNLAHLLAISGLHMGILTGLVFGVVRLLLATVPWTAFHLSTKKVAAGAALLAGLGYLMLSGATVATQRAFVMVAVALIAVLADRPAITLRALAVAALIILVWRPISVLDVGFQMSFAATIALVAGFEALSRRSSKGPSKRGHWAITVVKGVGLYVLGLLLSSLLAGLATAPFAAFHFNRTAPYGLLSNLLALPIMGFWIAPTAVLAGILAPLGLAQPVLDLMGFGIARILDIAHFVSGLPGAVRPVGVAQDLVLGLMALGGLWLALWTGRWRLIGCLPVVFGLVVWSLPERRPDVLVSDSARLIGVMGPEGRVLDHPRTQSYAAKTWLRRDGDLATQEEAAARPGFSQAGPFREASLPDDWRLEIHHKTNDAVDLVQRCTERTIIIARRGPEIDGPCLYFGEDRLQRSGPVAITIVENGPPRIDMVRHAGPYRLWERQ